jgi:uncharacterized protein (DUF305 family)
MKPSERSRDANVGHYGRFAVMMAVSFAAMYALMYAMVDVFENVLPNNNQLYMAGLMTAAMAIIELALMGGMYPNKKWNVGILAISALALAAFWFAIRQQAAVSDRQFLKSMIPHHAGAILMCDTAPIRDAEIQRLCAGIVSSQQAEIAQMKAKLQQLERR